MYKRAIGFFRGIVDNFGWHFAVLLISVYTACKGFVFQAAVTGMLPFFRSLNITGEKYQSYGVVAQTPWAMKAVIGLVSDTIPLFGYHKRSYILIVSVLGSIAFAILAFHKFTADLAPLAAVLLMFGHLQLAAVDLLCEGKYAEMMVSKPESGSDLVTYVWGLYMTGAFFGSLFVGPMADHFDPRYIFLICLPLAAQVILPTAAGWLPETYFPPGERGIRMDKVRDHPDLVRLSFVMSAGALLVGASALLGSGGVQSSISTAVAFSLCVLGMKWLPGMLRRANLYMFLSSMLYVSLPGALDYWFMGDEECVPGGPHFKNTFYITYASVVGSIAGAIGVAMFQAFMSRRSFRTAFWTTSLVKLAASFADLFIVKRYNKRFGIPDRVAFMLGDAMIFQVAYTLDFMPAVVLTSKVCPKGMEAIVYALLASYQNLGTNVASTLGVALIDMLGIKTTKPCDFTNLPTAILIAHVFLPLLAFPLVFVLIPDAKMTDDLLEESGPRDESRAQFERVPTEDPENGSASSSMDLKKNPGVKPKRSDPLNIPDEMGSTSDEFPETGHSAMSSVVSFTPNASESLQAPLNRAADIASSAIEESEDLGKPES